MARNVDPGARCRIDRAALGEKSEHYVGRGRRMALKTMFVGSFDPLLGGGSRNVYAHGRLGRPATIKAVDVFELTEDRSKFAAVMIIYDTAPVRLDFDKL